jgi:hypothetical protein
MNKAKVESSSFNGELNESAFVPKELDLLTIENLIEMSKSLC